MKKDLGIDLDDLKRVLSNLNDSVVSEMVEDFRGWDLLSKFICSGESYHSDHAGYTDLSVYPPL